MRVVAALRRLWCGLIRGHYDVLQVTRGRVFLKCTHCLRETPGWNPSNPQKRVVVQSLSSLI